MSKYTEKSKEYTMQYMKDNLEEIRFRVKKGEKDKYKEAAENAGKNVINWYCSKIGMEATSFRRGALRNGRSFCLQKIGHKAY